MEEHLRAPRRSKQLYLRLQDPRAGPPYQYIYAPVKKSKTSLLFFVENFGHFFYFLLKIIPGIHKMDVPFKIVAVLDTRYLRIYAAFDVWPTPLFK